MAKMTIQETIERARRAHEGYVRAAKIETETGLAHRKAQAELEAAHHYRNEADGAVLAALHETSEPIPTVPRAPREDEPTQTAVLTPHAPGRKPR